ncbi:helix-turn-helix domain-containing protein [Streptococcus gallolyticus]|uniref:helix-turn-helix domain-containing protein n=1 Tax=Streptococcus hepaticus TaxID=3349163 RepID=UPI001C98BEB3|nr:helix-turn-helix domain-containing protein [Streptococcus gallolyticus]MBY5040987.1 helix-turn-helix domain-containing protein [Streptococcus gallolyticus]
MIDLENLFPGAKLVKEKKNLAEHSYLSLPDGKWLELETAQLTDREQAILTLLVMPENPYPSSPWSDYLLARKGNIPQFLDKVQFLHVRVWKEDSADWLDMMVDLLPNAVSHFRLSPGELIFVLHQGQEMDTREILTESIQALEIDFNVRLSFFLGQIWHYSAQENWPALFQAERNLFNKWQEDFNQSTVLTFSKLYLWAQSKGEMSPILAQELSKLIAEQDQLKDIILALWEESAVVTKAAQKLYLHRNTLQYRLDKWHELTGLQLKELTDLTLCYSLILHELF